MPSAAARVLATWGLAWLLPQVALGLASGPVLLDGAWRFTAVTERLIRIEYDEAKQFVDEPTSAFLRAEPLGLWAGLSTEGDWSVLNTSAVSVRYWRGGAPGAAGTVSVSSRTDSYRWAWGDDPVPDNLRGTARTFDGGADGKGAPTLDLNCFHKVSPKLNNSDMLCTWGLVSRAGWAVVDQTGAPVLRDGWYAPSRNTTDISVFLHGLDFKGALLDFFHASGTPALPPRYAFGTMYTRWWNFDSDSTLAMIDDFENNGMPLDSWIFDMNWHQYGSWGSFSWNRNNFPNHNYVLSELHSRGLKVAANFHEVSGFKQDEDTYLEICSALGRAPGEDIPFDLYNQTYAMAQENIAVRALEAHDGNPGFDFSWIDYQSGETTMIERTLVPNLSPTAVLNRLRSEGPLRRGENLRPMILSRWGGLGSHRYPVGFSGDQEHTWEGLSFLPYFTSTAANVAFNYWSHDTTGGQHTDYELSVRWAQLSAWSPIFRFHDKGQGVGPCAIKGTCDQAVPWEVPSDFFGAIRRAAWERQALVPYIYSAAWAFARTGEALVRPMYYEDPSDPSLYGLDAQYFFGPSMIISPITRASSLEAQGFEHALGAVQWSVYAPNSSVAWVDRLNGNFFNGQMATSVYGINDVPGLVREGSVIPMRPPRVQGESYFGRAGQPLSMLEFRIMPARAFYNNGQFHASGSVIDDDGLSLDYLKLGRSVSELTYRFQGGSFDISLGQDGDFDGRPAKVMLRLSFPQLPPMKVLSSSGFAGLSVKYDHELLGPVVIAKDVDLTLRPNLTLALDASYSTAAMSNLVGSLGRVRRARYAKNALNAYAAEGYKVTNLTSYVLAAAQMSPDFAAGMNQLWDAAQKQAIGVLEDSKVYGKDPRRYNFITQMLTGDASSSTHVRQSIFV